MKISDETLANIKKTIDCRILMKSFGININNSNISCSNLNTNHVDKNPSMAVYQDHALCFGCGFNADAIKIVQVLSNKSFQESVEYLCNCYNVQLKYNEKIGQNNILKRIWNLVKDQKESNEFISWMNNRNIDYIVATKYGCRDIFTKSEKIRQILSEYSEDDLNRSSLINEKKELWKPLAEVIKRNTKYKGFLIPVFDENNNIICFRYRLYNNIFYKAEKNGKLIERNIKVYAQSKSNSFILGLNDLNPNKNKSLYICEGEPDFLSLKSYFYMNGIDNDVIGLCVLIREWPNKYNNILKNYKSINIFLHDTEKAKKLSDNIQFSLVTSCEIAEEKNYWKNNFFEYYFNEKYDLNDRLVKNDFDIKEIKVINKLFKENHVDKDNIEILTNDKIFKISSLNLNNKWIHESPNKEKSLLNSINNDLVIPQGDVGLFVAAGGTGKTQLLMQLVVSLSTNNYWLNSFKRDSSSKGKILYAFGEENFDRIQRRFQKIFEDLKLNSEQREKFLKEVVFLSLHKVPATFTNEKDSFQNNLKDFMLNNNSENGWSLIILDPASRFLPKDAEIDNASATAFIRECEKFTDLPGNPTILISHHVNKSAISGAKLFSEEFDSNQTASRGASGLVDGARFVINVDTILKEDWLKNTKFRNNKLLKIKHSKINCGPQMTPINAAVDEHGIIFPLSESEEEELKEIRSLQNSGKNYSNKNLVI
ncbi:MAG: hypothetical protein DCC88_00010 [Spirobacillus cienkowskii]|uniref:Zinc finger CHC2-type domain-containing protein n=1 Tax=Spirobacillus cienkowskii TaxID=495820 RepID=A0A369L021_9BACT|nr:MAG: hypothetical protein DCC88_00010 [Spirobacillus cienkowskii]